MPTTTATPTPSPSTSIFKGLVFYVSSLYPRTTVLHAHSLVLQGGGQVKKTHSRTCTHVLIPHCDTPEYTKAQQQQPPQTVTTIYWLYDCGAVGGLVPLHDDTHHSHHKNIHLSSSSSSSSPSSLSSSSAILYRPFPTASGIPGGVMQRCVIAVTGFKDTDRARLIDLIRATGAEYTPALSRRNTHLVAAAGEGEKWRTAVAWGSVAVVHRVWVYDCVREWAPVEVTWSRHSMQPADMERRRMHHITLPEEPLFIRPASFYQHHRSDNNNNNNNNTNNNNNDNNHSSITPTSSTLSRKRSGPPPHDDGGRLGNDDTETAPRSGSGGSSLIEETPRKRLRTMNLTELDGPSPLRDDVRQLKASLNRTGTTRTTGRRKRGGRSKSGSGAEDGKGATHPIPAALISASSPSPAPAPPSSYSSADTIGIGFGTRPTAVVFNPIMYTHRGPEGHPEQPLRINRIWNRLSEEGLLEHTDYLSGRPATPMELHRCHTRRHIQGLAQESARCQGVSPPDVFANNNNNNNNDNDNDNNTDNNNTLDSKSHPPFQTTSDVYVTASSYGVACVAAGCVVDGVSQVLQHRHRKALAIVRPPGHHAEADAAMGFCLFNNVAVAARIAQDRFAASRVLIADLDVHHGNGTQHIFEDDPSVLYFSVHRHDDGTFYPSTGSARQVGTGTGRGFTVNAPWPMDHRHPTHESSPRYVSFGDMDYLSVLSHILMPIGHEFNPDLVIVSLGFDAIQGDPLGGMHVSRTGFAHMIHMLRGLAGGRMVVALEGGYNVDESAEACVEVMRVLTGEDPPSLTSCHAPHPLTYALTRHVAALQAPYWKCMKNLHEGLTYPNPNDGNPENYDGDGYAALFAHEEEGGLSDTPYDSNTSSIFNLTATDHNSNHDDNESDTHSSSSTTSTSSE